MKQYCVGFAFSHDRNRVALIRKKTPEWQRGRLNGIGGHIEDGEAPSDAMVREFQEETGQHFDFSPAGVVYGDGWVLRVFRALVNVDAIPERDFEEGTIEIHRVADLDFSETIPNLRYLVPLCLDLRANFRIDDNWKPSDGFDEPIHT